MIELINKVKAFFDGKKSYIAAVVGAILALLEACGVHVPVWVYTGLSAIGLATLRSAIGK